MIDIRRIKLVLSYDGSGFSGWQRQNGARSVQAELEKALEKIHKHPIAIHGSGRTDCGVHARAQVAHFDTDILSIPAEKFTVAINSLLPQDVRILLTQEVFSDFHARFDAKSRLYRYHIICGRPALAHELRYAWQLWHIPNIQRLNRMAAALKGEMDCSSFASTKDSSKTRQRYLYFARFIQEGTHLVFEIQANAFLFKMVRSIVGTLIWYEQQGYDYTEFKKLIGAADRSLAGPTAPPQGLFLWEIDYYRS